MLETNLQLPKNILIIGGGFMGRGIAQLCAMHKFRVFLIDKEAAVLAEAQRNILWSLEKLFSKQKIDEKPEEVIRRVTLSKDLQVVELVDFLIECLPEKLSIKKIMLRHFDQRCHSSTIFATNTSAIPIRKIAETVSRQDKVIGTHFASPPVLQNLVEMVPSVTTSEDTKIKTKAFLRAIKREIIEVQKDIAGFLMNRIYLAAAAESIRLLEKGVANRNEIDSAMRMGYGWTKGPLEAADLAGLDVILGAIYSIWESEKDPVFQPPASLERMVKTGRLGRKTGSGFYDYENRIVQATDC